MPHGQAFATSVLDWLLNGADPAVMVPWISLHSAAPGLTGASELSGAGYGRVNVSACFPAAGSGACSNDAEIAFPTASGAWSAATHWGLWTAETVGVFVRGWKIGTFAGGAAAFAAWWLAYMTYLVGDGADPGAAPAFTPAPRTAEGAGDILAFPVGALTMYE